ncbi:MAG: hypothetical protein AABZ02_08795 [Bacteroidota bacterium]
MRLPRLDIASRLKRASRSLRPPLTRWRDVPLALLGLTLTLALGPCDEPLPPYQEPDKLFIGRIEGEYWLSDTEHSLRVYLYVTNIFDETLESPASLKGTIEIFFARDPNIRKTFSLSSLDLVSARGYNPSRGVIRIDPRETIVFRVTWDFPENKIIDDIGRDLADFFTYFQDKTCKERKLARLEDLVLQGSLKVFERTAPVAVGSTVFTFCYVTNFVSVKVCPEIVTRPPCVNYWPQNAGQ